MPAAGRAMPSTEPVIWRGQALGAPATLVLNHEDRTEAQALIKKVVAEVARLEGIFSLYRENSALSELNRVGALAAPPAELVELLETCRHFHQLSDGRFDPAIQPLWALYARHFVSADADPAGPTPEEIRSAVALAGFDKVHFDRNRVAFSRPGMAVTLNGIAQGYVTDRIVMLLRDAGVTSSLVDMGENSAIGSKADGSPWRIGLASFENEAEPDLVLDVTDRSVATSSGAGFLFDPAGRFSHILDPRTGTTARQYERVSVVAPLAATADALSTAFALMTPVEISSLAKTVGEIDVHLRTQDGQTCSNKNPAATGDCTI
ncbi:FAD:protein FMN transferase [Rhizobium sp. ARZ01]|uniref:FAD:protein FMN transferase n=1 Tax=Rhizobium sp. ARZ01 TaxID=2769313 RepID=UPI001FEFAAE0|nr:FAD:protein FMN transferase [Rhizobium sp. ARZ01]